MIKARLIQATLLFIFMFVIFFSGRGTTLLMIGKKKQPCILSVLEKGIFNSSIKEGYVSQRKETVKVFKNGKEIAEVKLSAPKMVAQSNRIEKWGYFQFPRIGRTDDGKLIVNWQMSEDSYKSYGIGGNGQLMSSDEGNTWKPLDKKYHVKWSRALKLRNGDILQVYTPASKYIKDFQTFPTPIISDKSLNMDFYLETDLPEELRGTYLDIYNSRTEETKRIHGVLSDPNLIRYTVDGFLPIMWWGDIKELTNGSLIAGVYRCYYKNSSGEVPKSAITFYKSNDGGYHWKAISKIPYQIKELTDENRQYDRTRGFSEACFEILKDSTFFCVIRSGYNTPMYKVYSYDRGNNWTEPEAFTPNGVRPMLLQLGNGVMVMTSGRPGLQLRFNIEGDGKTWTEPIEMLPLKDEKGYFDIWSTSCGYSCLLPSDDHSFYMVYSDFTKKNEHGEERKAIMFRKVDIKRKF